MNKLFFHRIYIWVALLLDPNISRAQPRPSRWFRRLIVILFPITFPLLFISIFILMVLMMVESMVRTVAQIIYNLWTAP